MSRLNWGLGFVASCTLAQALGACSLYTKDLLEDAGAAVGGSGPASGGADDGSGGASSSGGSGGTASGGEPNVGGDSGLSYELIDNMEDNNLVILITKGRNGNWGVYNDGSAGTQEPDPFDTMMDVSSDPSHADSDYAVYSKGEGFMTWGAVLSVSMKDGGAEYDASAYAGLRFYIKAGTDSGVSKSLTVRLPTGDTDPSGGICQDPSVTPGDTSDDCYAHFQTQLSLSTSWQHVELMFDDFGQPPGGMQFSELALDRLKQIEFVAGKDSMFEYWIDDLEFIRAD